MNRQTNDPGNAVRPSRFIEVRMPNIGEETFIEKLVSAWCFEDGDEVEIDEPLFVVSTDKVDVEVVSPATGTLQVIVAAETTVKAGELIAVIHCL